MKTLPIIGVVITAVLVVMCIGMGLCAASEMRSATGAVDKPKATSATYQADITNYAAITAALNANILAPYTAELGPVQHILDAFMTAAVALLFGGGAKGLIKRRLDLHEEEMRSRGIPPKSESTA
jgi:hypothetical protein